MGHEVPADGYFKKAWIHDALRLSPSMFRSLTENAKHSSAIFQDIRCLFLPLNGLEESLRDRAVVPAPEEYAAELISGSMYPTATYENNGAHVLVSRHEYLLQFGRDSQGP
jgi:hypothetical protein